MTGRRLAAALLLVATTVSGCMGSPRTVASPKTYLPIRRPGAVWVRKDGERFRVDRPRLLGDSLYGRRTNGEEVWIAFDDTNTIIEARELDKPKTYAAIGGAVAAVVVVGVLMGANGTPVVVENEDAWVFAKPFHITFLRIGR